MTSLRNDPHEKGVDTGSIFPPLTHDNPVRAQGSLLLRLTDLDDRGVREVRTDRHGVLAVGVTPDGTPFAVGNTCRHQFAQLGRGRVTEQGCLECPWHRARYDVSTGAMTEGPSHQRHLGTARMGAARRLGAEPARGTGDEQHATVEIHSRRPRHHARCGPAGQPHGVVEEHGSEGSRLRAARNRDR